MTLHLLFNLYTRAEPTTLGYGVGATGTGPVYNLYPYRFDLILCSGPSAAIAKCTEIVRDCEKMCVCAMARFTESVTDLVVGQGR